MENAFKLHSKDIKSIVAQSFNYLINSYSNKITDQLPKFDLKNEDINKHQQYFCNNECREKFNKVIEKIKNKEIQLDKIDISQSTGEDDNIIANALLYYYQSGYWTALQEKQAQ